MTNPLLHIEKLTKSFDGLLAVNQASLSVTQGEIVGLIGPNGSGKSTLLNLVAGFLTPDTGSIRLGDRAIGGHSPEQICDLGIVRSYQEPALFQRMTVLDNTLLPAKGQKGERPTQAPWHRLWREQEMKLAGRAANVLEQLLLRPLFAARAADLSGGQMKLLELGRSLMGDPQLMLLDEPTAGVAPNLAYEIFQEIERLRREEGLTFLIVEHRLEILFDFVDRLYVMHLGEVIAQGTPDQVSADPRVREVYFGS